MGRVSRQSKEMVQWELAELEWNDSNSSFSFLCLSGCQILFLFWYGIIVVANESQVILLKRKLNECLVYCKWQRFSNFLRKTHEGETGVGSQFHGWFFFLFNLYLHRVAKIRTLKSLCSAWHGFLNLMKVCWIITVKFGTMLCSLLLFFLSFFYVLPSKMMSVRI